VNYLKKEYTQRNRWDRTTWPTSTPLDKENFTLNLPVIYRTDEKYICPEEYGWESRYYKRLLDISPEEQDIKKICINYLEGLEWVFKYYTGDCPNWRWKYSESYPPLLSDLIKYIPSTKQRTFLEYQPKNPFKPTTQLAYVLPPNQFSLLPDAMKTYLLENHSQLYPQYYEFKWAFCRYFWEAHPVLPEISLSLLDKL
jgi:5'-3' exonuclease